MELPFDELVLNIVAGIIGALLISFFVWMRSRPWTWIILIFRRCRALITRRRYVLIWNDFCRADSEQLGECLQASGFPRFRFVPISETRELLLYPLTPAATAAVILMDCDVTKFSEDATLRDQIQQALEGYVSRGGGIVGTHDIVYRRTRNEILEPVFGCRLTDFRRQEEPVAYKLTSSGRGHPIAEGFPEQFTLSDGEIVWGDWPPEAVVIFESADPSPVPLVVTRQHGRGRAVWLNSGDTFDHPPVSIARPEPHFVQLLCNSVRWVGAG